MGRDAEEYLLRKYPNSQYWYFRLKGWKNFKSTKLKTKAAAKKFAIDECRSLIENKDRPLTLGEFAGSFFDWDSPWCIRQYSKGRLQETTATWRRGLLKNQILPYLSNKLLEDLTPNILDSYIMSLSVADRTKEHVRTTLRIILKEAQRDRLIKSNPMDFVERLNVTGESNQPPSMNELRKIFPKNSGDFNRIWPIPHYGVMCTVMATSGLRMQEVRALTPKSLVIEKQGIFVVQAVKSTGIIGFPKADEIRVVLAPKETMNLLSWWMRVMNRHDPDELLFPGRSGEPIDRKAPYKYFRQALDKAKIDRSGRKLTVHGLRHAYNTRMRQILTEAAIDDFWDETQMCFANKIKTADQILREYTGHRSKDMTDLYDHPDLHKKLDAFQSLREYTERFWNIS